MSFGGVGYAAVEGYRHARELRLFVGHRPSRITSIMMKWIPEDEALIARVSTSGPNGGGIRPGHRLRFAQYCGQHRFPPRIRDPVPQQRSPGQRVFARYFFMHELFCSNCSLSERRNCNRERVRLYTTGESPRTEQHPCCIQHLSGWCSSGSSPNRPTRVDDHGERRVHQGSPPRLRQTAASRHHSCHPTQPLHIADNDHFSAGTRPILRRTDYGASVVV